VRQPLSDNQLLQQFSVAKGLKTRVDVDGTLIIPGRLGHIYQYDHHTLAVVVIPSTPRKNYWGITRKKLLNLGFTIVQDGDCEGAAVFDPSKPEQAKAAIGAARICRKRRVSPSQVHRQITWLRVAAGRAL
jgi:hypothetical protein